MFEICVWLFYDTRVFEALWVADPSCDIVLSGLPPLRPRDSLEPKVAYRLTNGLTNRHKLTAF